MTLPLTGVRVVEFSHMVMGPSCGLILADLGAEVIKVEPRGPGDKTRYLPGSGSGLFATFNRNKKSVQLDVANPDDFDEIIALVESAQVVVENFRPGKMAQYGLGFDDIKQLNPAIIYCSLKGFLNGPYGDRSALDEVVQMLGGLAYMTGPPGQPLRAGASVNDIMGGMFGVIGIISSLLKNRDEPEPTHITSALFENTAFLVGTHMVQSQMTDDVVKPMPARLASWPIYDIFRSKSDEMIFVAAVSDTQWAALCHEFSLVDLLDDPALADNAGRVDNRDYIHERLQAQLRYFEVAEIEHRCERSGLPSARVNRPDQLLDDPHLSSSGAFVPVYEGTDTEVRVPLLPMEFNGARLAKRIDIPLPGQHDAEILNRQL